MVSVADVLKTGAENAINGRDLCAALHVNMRELGFMVEKERRAGKPICASSSGTKPGYYLAADKEEMQRYCKSLFHRAGEIHKTRRACLKTLDNLPAREADDIGKNSN